MEKKYLSEIKINDINFNETHRFASIGEIFDKNALIQIAREIEGHIKFLPKEPNIYGSFSKFKQSNINQMPEETKKFILFLNSKYFINLIENISGIKNLHPDPDLIGGGIHAIGENGYLKLHTDFNWNSKLNMHRRLNLLIYLNESWLESWKGDIEIWNANVSSKVFSMSPVLGNALVFETNDISYHGHPEPLLCPSDKFRKSIAIYYYTIDRTNENIKFGKSEMTNYIERPGEMFHTDALRRLRHKIILNSKKIFHEIKNIYFKK
jgi:Rps23 Pro-64 3,4-dihydroxylase Tpa1-like proline 4-hydroxylase